MGIATRGGTGGLALGEEPLLSSEGQGVWLWGRSSCGAPPVEDGRTWCGARVLLSWRKRAAAGDQFLRTRKNCVAVVPSINITTRMS